MNHHYKTVIIGAAHQQEQQQTSTSTALTNNSPNSVVTSIVSGYCNDGTYVTGDPSARGRANACYGKGGWRNIDN